MKFGKHTRAQLAWRREKRDMVKAGWELVGETGGKIGSLHRGIRRHDHKIVDAKPAVTGRDVWIKVIDLREADYLAEACG